MVTQIKSKSKLENADDSLIKSVNNEFSSTTFFNQPQAKNKIRAGETSLETIIPSAKKM